MEHRVEDLQYDLQKYEKKYQSWKAKKAAKPTGSNNGGREKNLKKTFDTHHNRPSKGHKYTPDSQHRAGNQQGERKPHRVEEGKSHASSGSKSHKYTPGSQHPSESHKEEHKLHRGKGGKGDIAEKSKNHTFQQIVSGGKRKGHNKPHPATTTATVTATAAQESPSLPTFKSPVIRLHRPNEATYYHRHEDQRVISQPSASERGIMGRNERNNAGVVVAIVIVVLILVMLGAWGIWCGFFKKRKMGWMGQQVKRRKSGRNAGLLWDEDAESIVVVDDALVLNDSDYRG